MKKGKVFLIALLLIAVLVGINGLYTVEENEYSCIVRFSKIISTADTAGLHFQVPFLDNVK